MVGSQEILPAVPTSHTFIRTKNLPQTTRYLRLRLYVAYIPINEVHIRTKVLMLEMLVKLWQAIFKEDVKCRKVSFHLQQEVET